MWRMQADGGPGSVNGALDPSFDADGVAVIDNGFDTASGVARQPDGKLIVSGTQQPPAKPFAAMVWRVTANGGPGAVNGALDPTFGTGGAASFDAGTGAAANALALQADRRIVAAGKTSVGQTLLAFRVLGDPFSVNVARAGTGAGTVQSSPAGIDCTGACSGAFDDGSRVTLTATAASGSTFAGWSGAGCGGTDVCGLTMNADQTVTATFNAVPATSNAVPVAKTHFVLRASRLSMKRFGHRARIVSAIISGLPRRTRLSGALVVGRTTLARARATAGATGRARLVFRFSRRARNRLRSPKLKAVTLKVTATPPGDTASRASKRIRLKPS